MAHPRWRESRSRPPSLHRRTAHAGLPGPPCPAAAVAQGGPGSGVARRSRAGPTARPAWTAATAGPGRTAPGASASEDAIHAEASSSRHPPQPLRGQQQGHRQYSQPCQQHIGGRRRATQGHQRWIGLVVEIGDAAPVLVADAVVAARSVARIAELVHLQAGEGLPHARTEEHTSEPPSHTDHAIPLLLEKKKQTETRDPTSAFF